MKAARSTTTRVTPAGVCGAVGSPVVVVVVVVVVVPGRRRPGGDAAAEAAEAADASEAACCAAFSSSLAACWTFSIGELVGLPCWFSTAWRSFCATCGKVSMSAVASSESFQPPQPMRRTIVLSTTPAPAARGTCQRCKVSTSGVSA